MAFKQRHIDRASLQTRGIFNTYVYKCDMDSSGDLLAVGYFAESRFRGEDGWIGGIIYAQVTDGYFVFEVQPDGESVQEATGSGSGGTPPTRFIEQIGHGFVDGQLVYFSESTKKYELGDISTAESADVLGVVLFATADNFLLYFGAGFILLPSPAFPSSDVGKKIYLGAFGAPSTNLPSFPDWVKPIGQIISEDQLFLEISPAVQGV